MTVVKVERAHRDYHGEFIGSRLVKGLLLAEASYAPGMELPQHLHCHGGFCVLLVGRSPLTDRGGVLARIMTRLRAEAHSVEDESPGSASLDAIRFGPPRLSLHTHRIRPPILVATSGGSG